MVAGDYGGCRPGWRHARQAGGGGVARVVRTRWDPRAAGPLPRGSRAGAHAVGVRGAAAPARGARQGEARLTKAFCELAARYRVDLILFAASLAAYALSSAGLLAHQSRAPHFVYQADASLRAAGAGGA